MPTANKNLNCQKLYADLYLINLSILVNWIEVGSSFEAEFKNSVDFRRKLEAPSDTPGLPTKPQDV